MLGTWQMLVAAHAVPSSSVPPAKGDDLAGSIIQAWAQRSGPPQWIAGFTQQYRQGYRLRCSEAGCSSWIGQRWIWTRLPSDRMTVGVISSRLGRKLDERWQWYAALRAVCGWAARQPCHLVVAPTTAGAEFIQRAGQLFALSCAVCDLPRRSESLGPWLQRISRAARADLSISPPVGWHGRDDLRDMPLADRVVMSLSDQIFALLVRTDSHTQRLLQYRLSDPQFQPGSVRVPMVPSLVGRHTGLSLLDRGAVGWLPWPDVRAPAARDARPPADAYAAPRVPIDATLGRPLLSHWTGVGRDPGPGSRGSAIWTS